MAPAATGQRFPRCATLGPETGWNVSLSPDGRRLAARTSAGTVRLMSTDRWREIAQLASALGRLDAVAFSPDGARLATLSSEMGQVALWHSSDGSLERTFAGPPASTIDAWASSLAFSSDGQRLATSLGILIDLWSSSTIDLETAAPRTYALAVNPENLSEGAAVPELRFVAADRILFAVTSFRIGNSPESTHVGLRDVQTGRELVLFHGYTRAIHGHALSPDGTLVATARTDENLLPSFDIGLTVFRTDTGDPVANDPAFTGRVLAFSSDGTRLVTQTGTTVEVLDTSGLTGFSGPVAAGLAAGGHDPLPRVAQWNWSAETTFLGLSRARRAREHGGRHHDLLGPRHRSRAADDRWRARRSLLVPRWPLFPRVGPGPPRRGAVSHLAHRRRQRALRAAVAGCAGPRAGVAGDDHGTRRASLVGGRLSARHRRDGAAHARHQLDGHPRADAAGAAELRLFGATSTPRPFAMAPDGARLFTQEGLSIAVWCR